MKVAVNGFGRIGRLFVRACLERGENIDIVAVNDIASPANLAYLFQYDTTYGVFDGVVHSDEESITILYQNKTLHIAVYAQRDPATLPWKQLGIDVVVECTGLFLTHELASGHVAAGARQVILSAPAKSAQNEDHRVIPTVVLGVNDDIMDLSDLPLISNASCTTNCIAPVIKAMSEVFDIRSIAGVTVHAYTASQSLQDGPNKKLRAGRAAATNLIPTSTGADTALIEVLPSIKGKLSISALRVPVMTGSFVYLTVNIDSKRDEDARAILTYEDIIACFERYQSIHPDILTLVDAPLVSSDIIKMSHSSVVDKQLIRVTGDNQCEISVWYDNEWGYTNRLVDMVTKL